MGEQPLPHYPLYLAGQWLETADTCTIRCPHGDVPLGVVHRAGPTELEMAIRSAWDAREELRRLPAHRRAEILRTISETVMKRREELARTLALEAAKPISQARVEISRTAFVFAQSAEEATRIGGETLNLDAAPAGEGRVGTARRFPVGTVAAITPFNFPMNLVAHKLGPAMAAGCPAILKPASQTPLSALLLAGIVAGAGWPAAGLSVLPMSSDQAAPLVEDPRIALLTFTGSPAVGWELKRQAGRKRVTLELGGNAAVVLHRDANLDWAIPRVVAGGFAYAGQTCISVQRVFVHREIEAAFLERLVPAVESLRLGSPLDESADLSSLISRKEAIRVKAWIDEAREQGARLLCGGTRQDSAVTPSVLTGTEANQRVNCQEVFGPVVTVTPFDDFEEALESVNRSEFGLQAGVFTQDIGRAYQAYDSLEVGGVMINDVPSWRVDHMPYGGVKASGFGREGIRYAVEEMTESRLMVIRTR